MLLSGVLLSERENLFRPVHKGIRAMLYQIGNEIQTTDFTDGATANAVVDRIKRDLGIVSSNCILCLLRAHSHHEEHDLFSAVRAQDSDIVDLMMVEHAEVARRIHRFSRTCDELLAETERARRIEVGDRLTLEANDLFAYYLAHLNNEEATMVPVMWDRFSDEQLRAMRAQFYDRLPLPRFEEWMRWTLPALNLNELIVLFSGLQQPPSSTRFDDWVRSARKNLDPARWSQLQERVHLPPA